MNTTYKPSDLRIGNILRDKLTGALLRVEGIIPGDVNFLVLDRLQYPLPDGWEAEGIPLKPEMLKQYQLAIESEYNSSGIYEDDDGKIFLHDCDNGWIGRQVEYYHELQNLYFALTGRELVTH